MPSRRSILACATAAAALCWSMPSKSWADDPIKVVATFSILGDMVARVGGEHISLTTLVGPNGDAHVYQPTPQAAKAVAQADVLFLNGLEFEGWLERLAESASFGGSMVVATTGIDAIEYDDHDDHDDHGHEDEHAEHDDHDDHGHEDEHAEHDDHDDHGHEDEHAEHDDHDDHGHEDEHAEHDDHDDHHGHDHGAFDPHAWQSPEKAVIYVDNITAGLAKADPDNAGTYYANRAAYVAELQALADEVKALMDALPADKRTVVTSHDAFGYFGKDYGLSFEAPQGLSTESAASAADVAKLIEQIRAENIAAVFLEKTTDNRMMQRIADETGAAIGGTLYTGALSDPDGEAPTYIDMIRHNAATLSQALGN